MTFDISSIFRWYALVQNVYTEEKSNDDIAVKAEKIAGAVWPEIKGYVGQLFPSVQPVLQGAAAALVANHDLVKKIQTALNSKMSPSPNLGADGYYGGLTKAAVSDYQRANGLVVDGWAGKATQAALGIV